MPDAIITSTESTFGTISGTFAADQSTVTGTITGIITGTLDGSVGVPGQTGATGPQGPQGIPGQGVPAGGTAGQYLQKIDGTNYNTDWVTLNLSAYALLSGANFTGRVTVPGIAGDESVNFPGFNIVPTQTEPADKVDGDLWVYDDEGLTPSKFRVFLAGSTHNVATEYWVSSLYAPVVSPSFSGNPTAPTQATSDNSIKIATTAFVKAQGYAPLASPAFTGNPTAPTAALADNDTSIATTAFVQQELLSGTANARNLEVYVRNQTGSTIAAGSIVYINGATGNRPTITLAQANNDANSAQTFGFTKAAIANNGFGFVIVRGELENIDTSALTEGVQLYLSPTTAGTWTTTKPSAPQHLVYVGICVRAHPTLGVILVAVQNGYELEELHDVSIGTLADNDLLAYESSTDLWKNKSFATLGLLTSSSLTGYATESWVTSQGYLTASSLTPYLTKADNLGSLTNFSTARDNLGLGSLSTPTFAGVNVPGSGTSVANLGATSLTINQQGYGQFTIQPSQGIVFPDTTIQTTAVNSTVLGDYLTKAGNLSGLANAGTARTNLGLGTMATASASDYSTTTVANGLYYPLSSNPAGYLTSAPVTSVAGKTGVVTLSNTDISGLGTLATVNDAPSDGNEYVRKNAAWSIASGGGSSYITSVSSPLAVSSGNLTVDLSTYAPLASPTFTGTPSLPTGTTAVTQTLGDNSTKVATTAFVIANAGGGGGGGGVDVQTFGDATTSGTFTNGWTKPAGAKRVEIWLYGGGGGGQSGGRQPTTVARYGGGGGAGGTLCFAIIDAASLNSTETVVVGSGGTGGASRTANDLGGLKGNDGGETTFKNMVARGGVAGGTVSFQGGAARTSNFYFTTSSAGSGGNAGANGLPSSGQTVTGVRHYPLGGGGAAGAAASSTTNTGGGSGSSFITLPTTAGISSSIAGGSGGTSAGVAATNGTSASNQFPQAGTGGGGGYYRTGEAGGTGGNGGWPGGGGGGGGASDNGFNSGAGGNGGNGYAVIITYF